MVLLAFLIPILTSIGLIIFCKTKVVWWEHLLVAGGGLLVTWLIYLLLSSFNYDTEYLGYYVKSATHYEAWDELKTRIETYTVTVNGHTQVRTRTRTYVDHHPDQYVLYLNDDRKENVSKATFYKVTNYMKADSVFRDMHRHFHLKDGDAYDYTYDNPEHMYYVTLTSLYNNPFKNSKSIFTYSDISKEEVDELGLHDYPDVENAYQEVILGGVVPDNHKHAIEYLNAVYGAEKHIRIYILVFKDKSPQIVEYQKSYWKGGNKNELVICLGYDTNIKEIKWADAFSWCDEPILEAATKQFFISHPKLNLIKYKEFITPYIESEWVPKDFSDFSYIEHDLSTDKSIFLLVITILYCILISIWVIHNEYTY